VASVAHRAGGAVVGLGGSAAELHSTRVRECASREASGGCRFDGGDVRTSASHFVRNAARASAGADAAPRGVQRRRRFVLRQLCFQR
jgi:hypothetical protein